MSATLSTDDRPIAAARPQVPPRDQRAPATFEPLHRRIQAAASRDPGALALLDGDRCRSFDQLEADAARLARHLVQLGAAPGRRIAVCLPRGADVVVALLGVLKSGAAFVPLDPSYPSVRRADMLADAQPFAVITFSRLAGEVVAGGAQPVLLDDPGLRARLASLPAHPPLVSVGPLDPAYVIYTSGSTGRPKGVVVPHRALCWHADAVIACHGLTPEDRVLQFASLAFDICIEEIFPTLVAGAAVVLRGPTDDQRLQDFLGTVARHRVTVLNLPTAFWHELVLGMDVWGGPLPRSVRLLVVGGEKASRPLYTRWRAAVGHRPRFLNAYGPTETTVTATLYEPAAEPDDDQFPDLPIGRPMPGVTCLVVDEAMQPVRDGQAGELCIGGGGVALGYLHLPERTAARFVPDPCAGHRDARMYRTGDRVRRMPDGKLVFLGRLDGQLKIRGFRVEPAEIEHHLEAHPDVAQAVVVGESTASGPVALRACLRMRPGRRLDETALREHLSGRLPDYMRPARWLAVEAFPMTPGGKVDRAMLATWPLPAATAAAEDLPAGRGAALQAGGVPPAADGSGDPDAVPQDLVSWLGPLFADALGLPRVDPDASLFDLGGHSLTALRLLSRLAQERPDLALTPPQLFAHPSVHALARALADGGGAAPTVVRLNATDPAIGGRTPLVCIAGVALYAGLARALADDRPVYGVFLPEDVMAGADTAEVPAVPVMAARYRERIEARLPHGPLAVAGVSFGGTLALEVARQLRDAGRDVRLLVPMDTHTPHAFGLWAPLGKPWLRWQARRAARRQRAVEGPEALDTERRSAALDRAEDAYAAGRPTWDGPALIVTATGCDSPDPPRRRPDMGWLGILCREDLGWHAHVPANSPVVRVTGDHLGILRPPGVGRIADAIRRSLGDA
jgi:amino acid adenylation domain-containing protein